MLNRKAELDKNNIGISNKLATTNIKVVANKYYVDNLIIIR